LHFCTNVFQHPTIMITPKITVSTTINAPVAQVWDYWTQPEHIVHWYFASPDWHAPQATNDLCVGGSFLTRMEAKDGSMGFDFEGTYAEVKPYSLIVYHIIDGREVRVAFEAMGSKTVVTETFEPENENPTALQEQGWQAILNSYQRYVEAN